MHRGVVVTEAGSYLRLIDSCITHFKAQGPSGTCNESKEEEDADPEQRDHNNLSVQGQRLLHPEGYNLNTISGNADSSGRAGGGKLGGEGRPPVRTGG